MLAEISGHERCSSLLRGFEVKPDPFVPVGNDVCGHVSRIGVVRPCIVCQLHLVPHLIEDLDHNIVDSFIVRVHENVDCLHMGWSVTIESFEAEGEERPTLRMFFRASDDNVSSVFSLLAVTGLRMFSYFHKICLYDLI